MASFINNHLSNARAGLHGRTNKSRYSKKDTYCKFDVYYSGGNLKRTKCIVVLERYVNASYWKAYRITSGYVSNSRYKSKGFVANLKLKGLPKAYYRVRVYSGNKQNYTGTFYIDR